MTSTAPGDQDLTPGRLWVRRLLVTIGVIALWLTFSFHSEKQINTQGDPVIEKVRVEVGVPGSPLYSYERREGDEASDFHFQLHLSWSLLTLALAVLCFRMALKLYSPKRGAQSD